jgi:(1->4)-alpha-D-glucan 1-alpha-D-glucosylmutase
MKHPPPAVPAPRATYRLQLNAAFPLDRAAELADYFDALGVSHLYLSPLFKARAGSPHGYDVVDPGVLNPELGTEDGFARLVSTLRARGMGVFLDVVPNHVCIADAANPWWADVLENGPSSPWAPCFDIDWNPPKPDLQNKVLLPVLGEQYGRVLEDREIRVQFDAGAFWVQIGGGARLPLGPSTWRHLLVPILARFNGRVGDTHPDALEFESILTALRYLPTRDQTDPEKSRERQREKEVVKQRLGALAQRSPALRIEIEAVVEEVNGRRGEPRSFDRLEALLADQGFRLSHWRVASDEINYRRFFDINELAAVRVEEPRAFEAMHALVRRLVAGGGVDGLRVDHLDGLFDPPGYLERLRALGEGAGRPLCVVVEKILARTERLPKGWAAHGTTGYDALNLLNGIFVDTASAAAFRRRYRELTGLAARPEDVLYAARQLILQVSMSGELTMLARRLDRLSEQHRFSRDFTLNSLQQALAEVMACFPVYRTYVRPGTDLISAADRKHVRAAVEEAKRRNPAVSPSVFEFVAGVLLLEPPDGLSPADLEARRDWVLRFQQLTGPVMAKGLEDTAFYRHVPLASLAEVGGDILRFGTPLDEFHARQRERAEAWPLTLTPTATHDTKRGEDTRARLNALSEIPDAWFAAVERWRALNAAHRAELDGMPAPDANEEYLIYQTLVGTWPGGTVAPPGYLDRLRVYLVKALREAKVHSSWIGPVKAYEDAALNFLDALLRPGADNAFLADFLGFLGPVERAGRLTSLAQVLLKVASPGVPDFYQGTEFWDLTLVDPDNRRAVDFAARRRALEDVAAAGPDPSPFMSAPEDGRIKLWLTRRALAALRARPEVYLKGEYLPLAGEGPQARRLVGFARRYGEEAALALAGRFFMGGVGGDSPWASGPVHWGATRVRTPEPLRGRIWRDALTGRELRETGDGLDLGEVFSTLPMALLESSARPA